MKAREMQMRDVEIIATFKALAEWGEDLKGHIQETLKQTGCSRERFDAALAAVQDNPNHLYWRK